MENREVNYVRIAYADILELTKEIDPAKKFAVRMTYLTSFLKHLFVDALIYWLMYIALECFVAGPINWFYATCSALMFTGANLIIYGTMPISKKLFTELFGDKEYKAQIPSKVWKLLIAVITVLCTAFVASFVSM